MVSCSNIPSTLIVLSLLLSLSPPFIHKPHNLVAADHQLISEECSKSENPTTCINSLKSNPGAPKAHRTVKATKLVESISNQGNHLVADMKSLVSKTKDQKLKAVFHDCERKYKTNKKLLASALQALHKHKYEDADLFLGKVFMFSTECHHYIEKHLRQVPFAMTKEIILYEKLSVDALGIIQGLH